MTVHEEIARNMIKKAKEDSDGSSIDGDFVDNLSKLIKKADEVSEDITSAFNGIANFYKMKYDAYVNAGFTEYQALELLKARGVIDG